MKFEIITIFPDFFDGPFDHGIIRRAKETGLIEIGVHDLRSFTRDKHRTVDDRPFGGGEGMVLKPEPIFECCESMNVSPLEQRRSGEARESVIVLSPGGEMFTQGVAEELRQLERVVLICGRYEGIDERVSEFLADRELSVGDFVLSGGELGAAIIVDAVTRLLPGALGNEASAHHESFTSREGRSPLKEGVGDEPNPTCASGGLLDYPHYTRPAEFRGMRVPATLLDGNHEQIRRWRRERGLEKTLRNRPDLLNGTGISKDDEQILNQLRSADSNGE